MTETLLSASNVLLFGREIQDLQITAGPSPGGHDPFIQPPGRAGISHYLNQQLSAAGARLARIYGFSYEGVYYDLPRPTLFLVHGAGAAAETHADPRAGSGGMAALARRVARSPDDPSRTGLAAPDFSLADNIMVWSYDKADYTIRLDVETGMFEQVLLDMVFGDGGGGRVSGAMVSGAMVGGPGTRGAMVRGAMVSGAMLRGRRGGRGDPSD